MFPSLFTVGDCLRLVDEGGRVCKLIIDIHKEGKASRLKDLEDSIQLWKSILHIVSPDQFPVPEGSSSAAGPASAECPPTGEKPPDMASKIKSAVVAVQQTAALLQEEIDSLEIEQNQALKSIMRALKTLRKEPTFRKLQERLDNHRTQLMTLSWFCLSKMQISYQSRTENDLTAIKNVVDVIDQKLSVLFPEAPAERREQLAGQLGSSVTSYASMCTESLNFGILSNRENSIAEYEPDTLPWLLEEPSTNDGDSTVRDNARHFLRREISNKDVIGSSPQSLFFIIGKAGSGKSTAMKALCNSPRIRDDLITWAGKSHVLVAKFYFSYRGTDLQKSLRGLIRALLYQCLEKKKALIQETVPQNAELDTPDQLRRYWTLNNLKKAFNDMLTHAKENMALKFCFFVDGLDECTIDADFDSPHSPVEGIMEWLIRMARHSNTKFCVSSRPEQPFHNATDSFPGFKLQEKTRNDISKYAEHRLGSNQRLQELKEQEQKAGISPSTLEVLIEGVTNNAEGVFLWVVLAIESLKTRISNHDSSSDLIKALNGLPKGLERLYTHILQKVSKEYLKEGIKYMLMVQAAGGSIPFEHLAFAAACDTGSGEHHLDQVRRGLRTRINACCMGLVEIRSTSPSSTLAEETISFLHKSVQDFLQEDTLVKLDSTWDSEWVEEHRLLNGYIWMICSEPWSQSFPDAPLERSIWFTQIKPIVELYIKTAERAARRGKPASLEDIKRLYDVADELWRRVSCEDEAEESPHVHWSKAKPATFASKDVPQSERISNVHDFIKYHKLDVRSQSAGAQNHNSLTVEGGCFLDPAQHLDGSSSAADIITELSTTNSGSVERRVLGQDHSRRTDTKKTGQSDAGRHTSSAPSDTSALPTTKKTESEDSSHWEREREIRRNHRRLQRDRQQGVSASTASDGARTANQECAKPTTEKPPSASSPLATCVKGESPVSGSSDNHDRRQRKPEANGKTKRPSPHGSQGSKKLQETHKHKRSEVNPATPQREVAESRSSPSSVEPRSSHARREERLDSTKEMAARQSSSVDVELAGKLGKEHRPSAARRGPKRSDRRRHGTSPVEVTPGFKRQLSLDSDRYFTKVDVYEERPRGASRRSCIIL